MNSVIYVFRSWRSLRTAVLLPFVVVGCSNVHPRPQTGGDVYPPDEMSRFEAETGSLPTGETVDEYVIGIGDYMDVVFMFHSNLTTRELIVRRDGRISLPYIGDQMAAGMTPMELDSVLTDRFSEILRDPNLSVIITTPAKQLVYVLGEVAHPGGFQFDSELSLLQSVALAGGLKNGAQSSQAVLIRRQPGNRIVGIEINIKDIMSGKSLSHDLRLRNFDVVYIPKTRMQSAVDFAEEFQKLLVIPIDDTFKIWQMVNLKASYDYFRSRTLESTQ